MPLINSCDGTTVCIIVPTLATLMKDLIIDLYLFV